MGVSGGQASTNTVMFVILICTIVGAIIYDNRLSKKSKRPRSEMSKTEVLILNIISGAAVLGMVLCILLGVLAMVGQRTPKLKPAPYKPVAVEELTESEAVEVTQNYQSFSVNAADAS